MVLRRCQFILLVDAGQDFDYVFEDLGNAIRKIRIDLGIPIEIKVVSPASWRRKDPIPRCAFGTIVTARSTRQEAMAPSSTSSR
jgi:hypothetical protein